jgi:hypothetical protein
VLVTLVAHVLPKMEIYVTFLLRLFVPVWNSVYLLTLQTQVSNGLKKMYDFVDFFSPFLLQR